MFWGFVKQPCERRGNGGTAGSFHLALRCLTPGDRPGKEPLFYRRGSVRLINGWFHVAGKEENLASNSTLPDPKTEIFLTP